MTSPCSLSSLFVFAFFRYRMENVDLTVHQYLYLHVYNPFGLINGP
jgi:hypothetical protein